LDEKFAYKAQGRAVRFISEEQFAQHWDEYQRYKKNWTRNIMLSLRICW